MVDEFRVKTHHRVTEDTEVAQRNPSTRTFEAKPECADEAAIDPRLQSRCAATFQCLLIRSANQSAIFLLALEPYLTKMRICGLLLKVGINVQRWQPNLRTRPDFVALSVFRFP